MFLRLGHCLPVEFPWLPGHVTQRSPSPALRLLSQRFVRLGHPTGIQSDVCVCVPCVCVYLLRVCVRERERPRDREHICVWPYMIKPQALSQRRLKSTHCIPTRELIMSTYEIQTVAHVQKEPHKPLLSPSKHWGGEKVHHEAECLSQKPARFLQAPLALLPPSSFVCATVSLWPCTSYYSAL